MPGLSQLAKTEPARTDHRLLLLVASGALCSAVLVGIAAGAQPLLGALPALPALLFLLWRRSEIGVYLLLGAALIFEQFPYEVAGHPGALTDRIPFLRTMARGTVVLPAELLLIALLFVWVLKSGLERSVGLPRSPVAVALAAFWVLLLFGTVVGLARGGSLKIILWELRPWMFVSVTYLLASRFLTTRVAVERVLWTFVLASGFKGIYGTVIFVSFARTARPRPEAILGHEEAFFFGVFLIITVALWLYGVLDRLRIAATALSPFVFVADLANSRRVAWLILLACLVVLILVAWPSLPERRPFLRRATAAMLLGAAVYIPLYWNHSGTLAQPARAVRSAVAPGQRDKSSDLYRREENINLIINIKASGKLGRGFGIPVSYTSSIVDISGIDSMITYIPHNGLLWIWMRLGIQGEIVLWALIACALISACSLARAPDRTMALVGAVIASSITGYVLMGYNDLGFAWLRIAVTVGCLLGMVEAASRNASPQNSRSPGSMRSLATNAPAGLM